MFLLMQSSVFGCHAVKPNAGAAWKYLHQFGRASLVKRLAKRVSETNQRFLAHWYYSSYTAES
jgi:hypothetical protein